MSNLFKQVRGEWVQLSEEEEERLYSSNWGPVSNIKQYLNRFVG